MRKFRARRGKPAMGQIARSAISCRSGRVALCARNCFENGRSSQCCRSRLPAPCRLTQAVYPREAPAHCIRATLKQRHNRERVGSKARRRPIMQCPAPIVRIRVNCRLGRRHSAEQVQRPKRRRTPPALAQGTLGGGGGAVIFFKRRGGGGGGGRGGWSF